MSEQNPSEEVTEEQNPIEILDKRISLLESEFHGIKGSMEDTLSKLGEAMVSTMTSEFNKIHQRIDMIERGGIVQNTSSSGGFFDMIAQIAKNFNPTVGSEDDEELKSMRKELTKIFFKGMLSKAKKDFGVVEHMIIEGK